MELDINNGSKKKKGKEEKKRGNKGTLQNKKQWETSPK